jgi:chitodextrinase
MGLIHLLFGGSTVSLRQLLNGKVLGYVIGLLLGMGVCAAQPGWQQLPNTTLTSVCPPNGYLGITDISDGALYPFSSNCANMFTAWSGAVVDTKRNRLIIWGGGHVDYAGNEIYTLNLGANPVTLTRITDPSGPSVYDRNAGPCPTTMPDGRPNTRHSNESLTYIPGTDRMFMFSGGVACGNGFHYDDTWTLDVSNISNTGTSGWLAMDPVNTSCTGCKNFYTSPGSPAGTTHAGDNWWTVTDYDPNTQTVMVNLDNQLFQYTYGNNSYVRLQSTAHFPVAASGVIDPKRKLFIAFGNEWILPPSSPSSNVIAIDISGPPYTVSNWSSAVTTCGTVPSSFYPGMAYDSVLDRIVMWPGSGNTVYLFDPDTKTCTTQTFPNGPPAVPNTSGGSGVMGRFRYIPSLDAFVVMSDPNSNAYLLTLNSGTGSTPPTVPTNLAATPISSSQINLSWTASTGGAGGTGYNVYRNGAQIGTTTNTSYQDTGLSASTTYSYAVAANDSEADLSAQSAVVSGTTLSSSPPPSPPTVPTNLAATAVSSSQINLSWTASTGGAGGTGYNIYRNGTQVGTAIINSYSDTGLSPSTSYSYTVAAYDSLADTSAQSASVSATTLSSSTPPPTTTVYGLGHSTFTCLDKDGDGYGVGPGCLGPDADDNDATVQTATQAIAKYGSMAAFLTHLGYNPNNIYYISAATNTPPGSDSNTCKNSVSTPCATFGHVRTLLHAGDMVMWRGAGTQAAPGYSETLFPIGGSSTTSPIIYMAYPGEKVWMEGTNLGQTTMNFNDVSYFIVDGLAATHGESGGCFGGGTSSTTTSTSTCHDVTFRNVEAGGGCGDGGIFPQNGIQNWTIEDSVLHDNQETGCGSSCQHGIYIGSRQVINSNVVVQRVITYNNNWNGIHMNGRCQGCTVQQSIAYSNGISGFDFENGFINSFVLNNLALNNATQGITFYDYYGNTPAACNALPVSSVPGCPFDQTGNLIENNTIYNTGTNVQTGTSSVAPAIVFNNTTFSDQGVLVGNLGNNTLRNNIFVSWGSNNNNPPIGFGDVYSNGKCDATCQGWLASDTFNNNIVFQNDGHNGANIISAGAIAYRCSTASSATTITNCTNANPQFVAAQPSFWNSVSSFNFNLQASSPGASAGTTAGLPTADIVGNAWAAPPSIGAYAFGSVSNKNPCDVNNEGVVNVVDVQVAINQALGITACTTADLQQNGLCTVIDVQRVVNAALGGSCVTGQ